MDMIFLLKCSTDISLFILIWLVQIIIYPSFRYVDVEKFDFWHTRYMGLITYFVAPLMLLQIVLTTYQLYYNFDWILFVSTVCIGLVWLSTAILSIPCHTSLQQSGFHLPTIEKLIATNWYRTILWTVVVLIDGFFL
jgi:hypothetical protein